MVAHNKTTATDEAYPLLRNEDFQRAYNAATNFIGADEQERLDAQSDSTSTLVGGEEDLLLQLDHHKTDTLETFLHLVKGYMGAGCLSLPWAVSQLGIIGGIVGIFALSLWSSYNCWSVVQLKRYMERTSHVPEAIPNNDTVSENGADNNLDDSAMETASQASTNITYPDVGEWAYGARFQKYVTVCICTQQLAICTVFVSFVGENLLAVIQRLNLPGIGHTAVMTFFLPIILGLSLIPSLKLLAPVMATGFVLLLASLAALGVIVAEEWSARPEHTPAVNPPQIPLALCAILYSYEGINLILPVESAMQQPEKFAPVFCASMAVVAMILVTVAIVCVYAFGNVTSGSVTAFLLEAYEDDESVTTWLMIANTAVSLSVLLTYPLQLFPALELLGPMLQQNKFLTKILCLKQEADDDENDLTGFEPLPPLPEHEMMDEEDMLDYNMEHDYYQSLENVTDKERAGLDDKKDKDEDSFSAISSVTGSMFPKMNLLMPGDSIQLRLLLVFATYLVAVVVPNVQSLISLAGALAGSSTALLIPPVLELAWMEHFEVTSAPGGASQIPSSPHQMRIVPNFGSAANESRPTVVATVRQFFSSKYWLERVKCYFLLTLGFIFMIIGTYASIADIIRIYVEK